ncbi:hypothetical protein BURMUCGD2M_5407 [Burkholderia multivorans CGD2M]|uniref:Uncharacterized protein n=1 Tax=Burkholderia multivorans CGD2 TaxID=513052 RepID=B9BK10_9BURK|nr:hypothetical protein BURMUCGD2_5417 [Burkholderia multivorans CGD2]EEE15963.1 hypothetical protein BURMUCGD2M_5407 [Burkholderia multivorans CGD2M]
MDVVVVQGLHEWLWQGWLGCATTRVDDRTCRIAQPAHAGADHRDMSQRIT